MKKNEKEIYISVIIAVYNCEKYIERCLKSVTNQNYDNFEVIVIDDGSTDKSIEICNKLKEKNNKINIIHKRNTGVSDSRNIGIKNALGDYLIFLDADDYVESNYLYTINNILKKNENIEFLNFGYFSDVYDINLKLKQSDIFNYREKFYKNNNEIKNDIVVLWDNRMLYNIWNKVYKMDIIRKNNISFPKFNWGEDVYFNQMYMKASKNLYNSEKCFYHYVRERVGAATKEYKEDFFNIRKREFFEFNNYFEDLGVLKNDYIEFTSRRFLECVLGCVENIYCSKMKFSKRLKNINEIINDEIVRETLIYANPKSIKVKIMLLPIKMRLTLTSMLMGRTLNIIKKRMPGIFNHLKNRR